MRPVGDILAESTPYLRIEADNIIFPQGFQPRIRPIAHRHHDGFLIHFEFALLGEMQAALPRIAETIRPLTWIAISLVPYVFLGPQPSLFAQCQNQLKHISVALAVFDFFLDVKHE